MCDQIIRKTQSPKSLPVVRILFMSNVCNRELVTATDLERGELETIGWRTERYSPHHPLLEAVSCSAF